MYAEHDLLPISALQHWMFCPRQCALIHIERLWVENRLTVEGRILHEKVHDGPSEHRADVRIARGLPLRSLRIGLSGIADVVEFHKADRRHSKPRPTSSATPEPIGPGLPFPIEYKRGRPKADDCDRVQLCAQALCLEEMFGVTIKRGAIYYGRTRRRSDVLFDNDLRNTVEQAATQVHNLLATGHTPKARRQPKCRNCSMAHVCLPNATSPARSATQYVQHTLRELRQRESMQET